MSVNDKSVWRIPLSLIALSALPVFIGVSRLDESSVSWGIKIHVVSVFFFCFLGAFQFSPGFRSRYLRWHQLAGRYLVPFGFLSTLSGLWLTHFHHHGPFDGSVLYLVRIVVGISMLIFLILGVQSLLRKRIKEHGVWMIRAYALGLGAGTQAFTHLPFFIFPSIQGELSRTIFMTLGWLMNSIAAEIVIGKIRSNKSSSVP